MTRFIAIASGKGGTGKTTTAVNLGVALNNLGLRVFVVDSNLTQPNIGLYLGFPQELHGFTDVLLGDKSITETIYEHPSGMGVIPSNGAVCLDGGTSRSIGSAMLELVGKADIVVIDVGAGLGNDVRSVFKSADETLIVTNPDHGAINEAVRTAAVAEELGSVVIGVILNKVTGNKLDIPLSQIKSAVNRPIISIIPEDRNVRKSLLMKSPVVCTNSDSPAAVEFQKLAELLHDETPTP
ncbi:P-loop NTPase [Candidatus Woesearchaeota archaeon]|nr:P-loop NTPase [Candidatus Woesearchaeota archaeon]